MIEQKGSNHDLNKAIRQSDGSLLTPFQQAQRYSASLPYSERPRWIVTCNFNEFRVYDMEQPNSEPTIIKLEELDTNFYQLEFLVDKSNQHIEKEKRVSLEAGELVGKIYNGLYKQYKNPETEHAQKSINQLCVRLVFCLYAEDAGIFGEKNMFHNYLAQFEARGMRQALIRLFRVLDTKIEERDPYLADDYPKLARFPYVNGGMFSDENIEIPPFTDELRELILINASEDFDWSQISPTIFGAVFESTLNPDTRRKGGMHYTSVENIHKVIDPLFLDDLKDELNEIKKTKQPVTLKKKACAFQEKISHLTFFDPACGSGNFLTETYLSLRKLENEAIKLRVDSNVALDVGQLEETVLVSIQNFYGIEINDFAVSVAKTALWIAESQMLEATKEIVFANWDFLPLKTYTNIHEGNALRMDWSKVLPNYACSYIMGNPPFVGYANQNSSQKADMRSIFVDKNGKQYSYAGKIDYVAGWYLKACQYIKDEKIKVAFVSTNSITQGEQVQFIWENLINSYKININFAYKSFKWNNDSSKVAQVYVVIIGFSKINEKEKIIFDNGLVKKAKNINPYLIDFKNFFLKSRSKNICSVPTIIYGNKPVDHGYLLIKPDELNSITSNDPIAKKYIKKYVGGKELINGQPRYCFWLKDANPKDIKKSPIIMNRINLVKNFRLSSKKKKTQESALTPTLFQEIRQRDSSYIAIPEVSESSRKYIPMAFLNSEVIASNKLQMICDANLYEFGILESNVHMAWVNTVAGRLGVGYDYSAKIVYNNFPWPKPTDKQKDKIEKTAQAILDARALYPDSSLADLYDPLTMPPELLKAHQDNDRAVMQVYGMDVRTTTESDAVAKLFEMYEKLVEKK